MGSGVEASALFLGQRAKEEKRFKPTMVKRGGRRALRKKINPG